MDEEKREQFIHDARNEGGIVMLHQKLQVHKNGAKFSVNKVYVDDELLSEEQPYTMILLPEKILPVCIVLSYFDGFTGPEIYEEIPENTLNASQLSKIQRLFETVEEPGEHSQASIGRMESINYWFVVPSEWGRTGEKELMISILLDAKPRYYDEIAREKILQFAEKVKESKDIFKAFYKKEGKETEINKAKERVEELLLELKKNLGF